MTEDTKEFTAKSVKDLLSVAKEGAAEVMESDHFKAYLKFLSTFHRYSARNVLLIQKQLPKASLVASYKGWLERGRHVKKGEHAIRIVGVRMLPDKSKEGVHQQSPQPFFKDKVAFFPVKVFDVSQTAGDPLPTIAKPLEGTYDRYPQLFEALTNSTDYSVSFSPQLVRGTARGVTNFEHKTIQLQPGLSQVHALKTMFHEMAHSVLHQDPEVRKNTPVVELEAESCAFILADHYGIDSRDYSFDYLASWSRGEGLDVFTNSLDKIQKFTHQLIQKVDTQLVELERQRPRSLEEKLENAKQHLEATQATKKEPTLTQQQDDHER